MTAPLIATTPREIASCVSAYLQQGNIDGVVSLFHPDCHIFFPPDQPPLVGIAGARAAFADFINVRPEIKSEFLTEVIVGDIALLSAKWTAVAPDGTVIGEGISTEVAKRLENGGWGYLIDCPVGAPQLKS